MRRSQQSKEFALMSEVKYSLNLFRPDSKESRDSGLPKSRDEIAADKKEEVLSDTNSCFYD